MTYVILSNYSDSRSECIYCGEDLLVGIRALCQHHCMEYRIQLWEDGKMIEELKK